MATHAPRLRRKGEARQRSELHEEKEGRNVCVDRRHPLTRLAPADENAAAVHPLPQGGEGIGSEAGQCRDSGLYDRGFRLREQIKIALARSRPCRWLSPTVGRPLFSSTFPVRSSAFLNSWGARPGFKRPSPRLGHASSAGRKWGPGGGLWRPSPDGLQAAASQLTG